MRTTMTVFIALMLLSGGLTSPSWATDGQSECVTPAQKVTGVATTVRHVASVNFITTGGRFHPTPLISATVQVTEPGSCLVVHFQPKAHPDTEYLVYQVRVNGVPMDGQWESLFVRGAPPAFEQPGFGIDRSGNPGNPQSLTTFPFLQIVDPGKYVVEVLYAVVCIGGQTRCQRAIDSATLIVGYQ